MTNGEPGKPLKCGRAFCTVCWQQYVTKPPAFSIKFFVRVQQAPMFYWLPRFETFYYSAYDKVDVLERYAVYSFKIHWLRWYLGASIRAPRWKLW